MANQGLFRAKYIILLLDGAPFPVLLSEKAGPADIPSGVYLAAGRCELHSLGATSLGFTVSPWPNMIEARCRGLQDVDLLDDRFVPRELAPHLHEPFTTRPEGGA